MGKWTVRRRLLGSDWFVYRAGYPQMWYFATWREALQFVGEQLRTVPVVLPAPAAHPPVDVHRPAWHVAEWMTRPWVSALGRWVHLTDQRGWGVQYRADTAEKLGLALLAAAMHAKGELP